VVEQGNYGNLQQTKYVTKPKPTFQESVVFGQLNANSQNFVMGAVFKPSVPEQTW
jgi:hypothetical protein